MKRGLLIFLQLAILLAFLRSSFAQNLLVEFRSEVLGWYHTLTGYAEYGQLASLRKGLSPHYDNLSEQQLEYLDKLTRDKDQIRRFSANYCQGNDINPYVYGETLEVVCEHFSRSKLLYPGG